ncbi:MAG TPA: hypothetical protein VNO25_15060 [Streptosporangiaceae bacterium]|jgi:hypothetical protein|nr:hypothetical protein [Streptosporangiaceae bacterium]
MRWERPLLRAGEYLVGRSCRHLPGPIRDERYREWTAELPAILNDPDTKPAVRRAVRMLRYAADTIRGTTLASGRARRRPAARRTAMIARHVIPALPAAAFLLWATVTASGNRVHYLLTVLLICAALELALLGIRRLRAHRTGRK